MNLQQLIIREELPSDYPAIEQLVEAAFADLEISDHQEHKLVARLRSSDSFIPQLALVAELDGEIVGYVLYTIATFVNREQQHPTLALDPLAVKPQYQKIGVGNRLMNDSLTLARQLGFGSVVIIGHPEYYPKFGCQLAQNYGLLLPFEVPTECFMICELQEGALSQLSGTLHYAPEFFVQS